MTKVYKPAKYLDKAIKATQECLDTKWSYKNIVEGKIKGTCSLCVEFRAPSCNHCPLAQFGIQRHSDGCVTIYFQWYASQSKKDARSMRKFIQETLVRLKKQKKELKRTKNDKEI